MWIQTLTGNAFDFTEPANYKFDAAEVATALARTARFGGHTQHFYSVAQHSVLVSRRFTDQNDRLAALLHDAAEAFIGDISRPVKSLIVTQSRVLRQLENRIAHWIDSIHCTLEADHDKIKEEDNRALATESRDLMEPPPRPWVPLPPPWEERIEPWSQEYARDEWLRCYLECLQGDVGWASDYKEEIKSYETMKEGMQIRIADIEKERNTLRAEVERLRLELANEQASGGQVISEMRQNSDELKAENERLRNDPQARRSGRD